jgi:hypothetical protein
MTIKLRLGKPVLLYRIYWTRGLLKPKSQTPLLLLLLLLFINYIQGNNNWAREMYII